MYGIIPAAPPPDPSYGLAVREVVSRGSDPKGSFAEQLSQVNSRASDQRTEAEKQRNDSTGAAPQTKGETDSSKASGTAELADKADHTDDANRASKGDSAAQGDTQARAAGQSDTTESEALRKKKAAERAEQPDEALIPGLVEAKTHKQRRIAGSGDDEADATSKSAVRVAKTAPHGGDATDVDRTSPEKTVPPSPKVAPKAQTGEKANGNDGPLYSDGTQTEKELESGKDLAKSADDKAQKPVRADGAPTHAENLVEQQDQSKDADRNRRVRAGDDPRESRIAAEKLGTKTVDAKAVSPVETDNTTVERTVTRELTVDLSEGTVQQRTGGDGTESSLTTGRMEIALGEGSSRAPSVSQATQTLARRLNGELGDNIVRQAKVMLQDANNAELRLVIRPPELGRIRIRLQMENGHIAGRILVDNGSVREVVEQNLASLQRAFEEAGLEMGDLEVSTGDARDDAHQGDQNQDGSAGTTPTAGAESFGRSIETISEYEPGRHRINLVA